jgi:competence protein ComEC
MINSFLFYLSETRTSAVKNAFRYLELQEATLLNGIVLGAAMPTGSLKNQARDSGLLHLVVVSGSNVSFINDMVQKSLRKASYWQISAIQIVIIVSYALFVGIQPPVFRAACMGIYSSICRIKGCQVSPITNLLISYILSILIFPAWISSLSCYLTYSASIAIVLIAKPILLRLPKREGKRTVYLWFLEEVIVSVAAQVGVTPVLWISIHQMSFISIITTPLVSWLVPYCMTGGLFFYLTAELLPTIAALVAKLISYPLEAILLVIHLFSG